MGFKKKAPESRISPQASARVYSRHNSERYSERAAQRRRHRTIKKGILYGLIVVLVGAVSAAGLWISSVMGRLNDPSLITQGLLATLVDSDVTSEPFYMLLLGTDGRPGEDTYRSDTIVLTRVDPQNKQVTLVSIPRDTMVQIDGYGTQKINAAHAYGGPEGVVKAVNELCGVQISHYAEVSFDGMQQLVDALGGVEVDVPDRIDDPKAGDVVIEPGLQTLNGEEALAFCRSRAFADGDFTRMRHQRIFIAALAKKVLESTDAATIVPLVNSLSDMVVTDLSVTDIAALANAMRGMDTDAIWSANVPSTTAMVDGVSYVIADEEELAAMMERVDAGEDPQGPQTSDITGESSTIGDLTNNTAEDFSNGTDTAVDNNGDGVIDENDSSYSTSN